MKAKKASIYGLSEFGLTTAQLTSLGGVKIKLHANLRHINENSLFKIQPAKRIEKMKRHYELLLSRVKKNWNDGPIEVSWIRRQPRGFTAFVEARNVSRLLRVPEIADIWISEIPGRKRKSIMVMSKEWWFAVKARFAIQVEGQMTGMQTYEDRIVAVKANSFEDAENKLQSEFKQYGTPYLNPRGFMVRWAYERVLDVYDIGDEMIDARGTEVFSALAKRRMKPEFAWKPKKKVQGGAK